MTRMRLLAFAVLAWLGLCGAVQAADPIKIGAVLPFSGGVELYGAQAKLGLDLAAADINAAGGILGRPVYLSSSQ
jgi:urea transport system substrate-binding protein